MLSGFQRAFGLLFITTFGILIFRLIDGAYSFDHALYSSAVALVQATIFCLPLVLVIILLRFAMPKLGMGGRDPSLVLAIFSSIVVLTLLTNIKLYNHYGFYLNSFAMNILFTPGGVAALGASESVYFVALGIFLALVAAFYYGIKMIPIERALPGWCFSWKLSLVFLPLFALQASAYSYAEYMGKSGIINIANRAPWYFPITAKSFYKELGVVGASDDSIKLKHLKGHLNYPPPGLGSTKLTSKPNIVWLVAESWRWDMLNSRIMPHTNEFANSNIRFENHYSGGNGTRMGMFTQFYGMFGSNWFDILANQTPPVLLSILRNNDYQMKAFTSASFTYPEFDKTVFSNLSTDEKQEGVEGAGWERDQINVSGLVNFIKSAKSPFFGFMFFESPHAQYYFPKEAELEPDYLPDFNYLTTDINENIQGIKNRYINACHHLDMQFNRVLEALKANNMLDNTIVILTGDHGEEFLEKGRWGHNSTFSQEQIRVPLVIHLPDSVKTTVTHMTSHLDIPATLLDILKVDSKGKAVSHGANMLSDDFDRTYTIVSDWHGDSIVTPEFKYILSTKGRMKGETFTNLDDDPMNISKSKTKVQVALAAYLEARSKFIGPESNSK